MPIWSKLGLIMVVPTLATIVVGTNGLVDNIDTASSADRTRILSVLVKESGALVDGLQSERAAAAMMLGAADPAAKQAPTTEFGVASKKVDESQTPYKQQRSALDDADDDLNDLLKRIDTNLANLPAIRTQVTESKVKLSDAMLRYDVLISYLLQIRDKAAQIAGGGDLGNSLRAAGAIASTKELLSKERVTLHRAFALGELNSELRLTFIQSITSQEAMQETFNNVASEPQADLYIATVAGPGLRESTKFQGEVESLMATSSFSLSALTFDAKDWDMAMASHAKLMRSVESKLDLSVVQAATVLRDEVTQTVLVQTGLLLTVLLVAILFAWLVARSMARSLRELRHGALAIAQYGLPQAVARLRDPSLSASLSPVQVANQIAEPLPVRSKDEFGQVTEAFNAVHLEAVRTAAEQAALRSSVATMFVNLARRSQILVDRLIGHLDRLERGEEDPDRLAELFQLDHLATRMRRNDENLLVLAGADSTRVQREPAALLDVLRAAQSEVEHYTRIEFGVVDRDIEVAAHAVNDLVHLIAELFDNATAFSPPDSLVMVEARRVGDRAALFVEDHGIGISPDMISDINERLATPPMVDVAVSRMMGLVVVARLGARHGVKVELRSSAERGIIADVTLPTAVLVPRALAGRSARDGAPAINQVPTRQPAAAPPRSPFATPLALESGPNQGRQAEQVNGGSRMFGDEPLAPPRQSQPTRGGMFEAPAAPTAPEVPVGFGGTNGSRNMPAWSDLTGVNGSETGPSHQGVNGDLPQRDRRPFERTLDGEVGPLDGDQPGYEEAGYGQSGFTQGGYGSPQIPRQMPTTPENPYVPQGSNPPEMPFRSPYGAGPGTPISSVPVSAVPVSAVPVSAMPVSAPAAGPEVPAGVVPPVWPPVSQDRPVAQEESFARDAYTSMDLTSEMPQVTQERPRVPYADETMELPIFRELESAWFSTRRTAVDSVTTELATAVQTPPAAEPPRDSTITAQFPTVAAPPQEAPVSSNGSGSSNGGAPKAGSTTGVDVTMVSAQAGRGAAGQDVPAPYRPAWQTAADDGWAAASAAASAMTVPEQATTSGLPKRVPMAQLVPGGVEKGTVTVQRRTPEGVRGLLSAYHRGVQRGRTQPNDELSPGSTETGNQTGKEQEA
jgi:signal transduction histidine kinase